MLKVVSYRWDAYKNIFVFFLVFLPNLLYADPWMEIEKNCMEAMEKQDFDGALKLGFKHQKEFNQDKQKLSWVLYFIGNTYNAMGDKIKAIEFLEKSLELSKEFKNPEEEANRNLILGTIYFNLNKLEKALECQKKSLEISKKLADKEGIAKSQANLGLIYGALNQPEIAIQFHLASYEYLKEKFDPKSLDEIYFVLGNAYFQINDLENSLIFFKKNLGNKLIIGNFEEIKNAYQPIFEIYIANKDFEKFLLAQEALLDLAKQKNVSLEIAKCYINIGAAHEKFGNLSKAMEYSNHGIELMEKLGNLDWLALGYSNLGIIFQKQQKYEKSLSYGEKSLEISNKINDPLIKAQALGVIGVAYEKLGNYNKALEFEEPSLKLFLEFGDQEEISRANLNLSLVYFGLGNQTKGFEFMMKSMGVTEKNIIWEKNRGKKIDK